MTGRLLTHRPRTPQPHGRQHGSIAINAAIAISLIVILLIGTELGYVFYMKREFQKTVDLAALAGALQLDPTLPDGGCGAAQGVAASNASKNLNLPGIAIDTPQCGHWAPANTTVSNDPCFGDTDDHFTPDQPSYNALRVRIKQAPPTLLAFFSVNRTICVQAVAASDAQTAVFSVGSKLIDTNPEAPLMSLLRVAGLDVKDQTCVLCYTGIATLKVTPGEVLTELGIPVNADLTAGGLDSLLAARRLSLGQVVDATMTVAARDTPLTGSVDVAGALAGVGLHLDDLFVQLGTDPAQNGGVRGLFAQIATPDVQSALAAKINVLDLITAAVGAGLSTNAIVLPISSPLLGVEAEARIIEPPSIGMGSPRSAGHAGATAYNAQIRVSANIATTKSTLLGGILDALNTQINLPIVIDVANAYGELTNIDCSVTPPQATIEVQAPILSACIGQVAPDVLWSKVEVCKTGLQPTSLVQILGADLLNGKVATLDVLDNQGSVTLAVDEKKSTDTNPLAIGSTLSSLLDQLVPLLLGQSGDNDTTPANRATSVELATSMANHYIPAGTSVNVDSVVSSLDAGNLTWNVPAVAGLISKAMPDAWKADVESSKLLGGCVPVLSTTVDTSCARTHLIASLQTQAQEGLLTGVIKGLIDLVSNLLGADSTPLLSGILGPVVHLLQPVLDSIGAELSKVLDETLGIELGRTDVYLQSVGCHNSKLVY